ncbi:MAG: sodium:proton antiporter [Bacilli bacterium]|jgi:hypothetical protein|nr:sodium:proton antiporter [Bacilli bacterium]
MKFFKKQSTAGYLIDVTTVFALIGLIFYIVTSTTGFLAGSSMDAWPIVLSIFTIAIGVGVFFFGDSLKGWMIDIILPVMCVLLSATLCLFVIDRLSLFADVWFIPVNYPAAEGVLLNISIVGIAFYIASIILTVSAGFMDKLVKE